MKKQLFKVACVIQLAQLVQLTLLTGCAISPLLFSSHSEEDPITEAALPFIDETERVRLDTLQTHASSAYRPTVAQTLHLGMNPDEVQAIWGRPAEVEAAGDPNQGNLKWIYSVGIHGRYGIGSQRAVYFENGRVAGWEN